MTLRNNTGPVKWILIILVILFLAVFFAMFFVQPYLANLYYKMT